jgi:hypothetical protein
MHFSSVKHIPLLIHALALLFVNVSAVEKEERNRSREEEEVRSSYYDGHQGSGEEKSEIGKPAAAVTADASGTNSNQAEESAFFRQLPQKINDKKIIALRFKKDNIVYISNEGTFYEEKIGGAKTVLTTMLSKIDCLSRYPKLNSLEFHDINFSRKTLEDVASYITPNIKLFAFCNCTFGKNEDKEKKNDNTVTNIASEDKNNASTNTGTFDEVGVKLLCNILKRCSLLTNIILKLPTLTSHQLENVIASLGRCSNLTNLHIEARAMGDKSCDYLANIIQKSSKILTCVTIGCDKFCTTNEKPVKKILDAIKTIKNPKYVGLLINNANERELFHLFNSLKDLHRDFKKSKHLKTGLELKLFVGNLKSYDRVVLFRSAEVLAKSLGLLKHLVGLDISGMNFNEKAMLAIIGGMTNATGLHVLNLSHNTIDGDCVDKLTDILKKTKLRALSMCGCFNRQKDKETTGDAGNLIAKILPAAKYVERLYLSTNNLKESIKSIQVKSMPELQLIDLSNNCCKSSGGLSFFVEQAIGHKKLQAVNLYNNMEMSKEIAEIRKIINMRTKGTPVFFGI